MISFFFKDKHPNGSMSSLDNIQELNTTVGSPQWALWVP